MKEIKGLSGDARSQLKGKAHAQQLKSHFSTNAKCHMLLNNPCKYNLEARDKSILTMIETITKNLMQIIALKHAANEKYLGPLCPKIQKSSYW